MATVTAKGSYRGTISEDGTVTVSGSGSCLIKVDASANYGSGTLTVLDDLAGAPDDFTSTLDDGAERLVPAPHVHIAGPIYPVITPAVIDEEGNVTTPAVLDTRPHYNLRIAPWAQKALADDGVTPRWQETVLMWMANGSPIDPAEKNKAEDGIKLSDITLIDPTTISSPAMRW
jgi:hypothetical protein